MENAKTTSFNGHFDYSKPQDKHSQAFDTKHHTSSNSIDQIMLDALMKAGFVWEEAIMLLYLREHLYENAEMRQRMTDDQRMHFARWLYINGEMNEDITKAI
jgi:hypothetical protein